LVIVHSEQVFVTAFFARYLLTNSLEGASVGSNFTIGWPIPTLGRAIIVCEGISPKAYPETAEIIAANAEYLKVEAIVSKFEREATAKKKDLQFGDQPYICR
jgi:hypothetical protein